MSRALNKFMTEVPNNLFHYKLDSTLYGSQFYLFRFRTVMALYFSCEVFSIIFVGGLEGLWESTLYQSHLGLYLTWLYFFLIALYRPRSESFCSLARVLNYIVICWELIVIVFFWGFRFQYFLRDFKDPNAQNSIYKYYTVIAWNTVPFITMCIETFWNRHTFKKSDIKYPVIIFQIYIAWVACLTIFGNVIIYKDLDFMNWKTALYFGVVALVLLLISVTVIQLLKNFVHKKVTEGAELKTNSMYKEQLDYSSKGKNILDKINGYEEP